MNVEQKVSEIEAAGLPALTNYRNERGLARAEKARFLAIQKIKNNLQDQIRINPDESAIQQHLKWLGIAYTQTDANLWQTGEEFIFRSA